LPARLFFEEVEQFAGRLTVTDRPALRHLHALFALCDYQQKVALIGSSIESGLRGGVPRQRFEFGERDLGFLVLGTRQPQHDFRRTFDRVVEQSFVDMADLLDVERAEGEPAHLGGTAAGQFDAQELESLQKVQHNAVVDLKRFGRCVRPDCSRGTAFEEGVRWGRTAHRLSGQAHVHARAPPWIARYGRHSDQVRSGALQLSPCWSARSRWESRKTAKREFSS
jgi:hypothetical protein